jgi:hypothetical protein
MLVAGHIETTSFLYNLHALVACWFRYGLKSHSPYSTSEGHRYFKYFLSTDFILSTREV